MAWHNISLCSISPLMFCPGGGEFKLMRLSEDSPRAPFWLMAGAEEVLSLAGVWEDEPASV